MIRPATPADLPALAVYLAAALGGEGGAERYTRYLEYKWLPDKPDLGVLIEDAGRIRGCIGAIYADRQLGGRQVRCCNLTSIAVDESHRKLTLQLFSALLRRRDVTFTCFSASDRIAKILDFFKFTHRPSDRVIVTPVSGLAGVRHLAKTRVVTRPEELDRELDVPERQLSRDHRAYRCGQLLLVHGDRRCFVITGRRGRGRRAFADVLYASDPAMLLEHLPWIHLPLFRAHGTVLTGIERSWVASAPKLSGVYRKLRPTYLRSTDITLDQLDGLYSERVSVNDLAAP
ncbi:MAG: GNAT family N-acetyltransferase [Myxococcota bacterium]|nr:GNAT family N-acetyltransferase [Myxococcota bacterium]